MAETARHDAWQAGNSYDSHIGRWSRLIAPRFLDWVEMPDGLDWLEVGCGTGALSAAILARGGPKSLVSIDPDERAGSTRRVSRGDAQALTLETASRDVIVSALVLNFVPDKAKALAEMKRGARIGRTVGFYV